jgi:hypothetical protein
VHHFNWWDSDSQLRVQSQRSFCLLELILSGRERIRIERRILLRILRCILVSGVQADSQIAIVLAIR